MIYTYTCDCGNEKEFEFPMNEKIPIIICEKCGKNMRQNYKDKLNKNTIIIPDNFKVKNEGRYQYDKYYGKHAIHEKQLY